MEAIARGRPPKLNWYQTVNQRIMKLNLILLPEWTARLDNYERRMRTYDLWSLEKFGDHARKMRVAVAAEIQGLVDLLDGVTRTDAPYEQTSALLGRIDSVLARFSSRILEKRSMNTRPGRDFRIPAGTATGPFGAGRASDPFLSGASNEELAAIYGKLGGDR